MRYFKGDLVAIAIFLVVSNCVAVDNEKSVKNSRVKRQNFNFDGNQFPPAGGQRQQQRQRNRLQQRPGAPLVFSNNGGGGRQPPLGPQFSQQGPQFPSQQGPQFPPQQGPQFSQQFPPQGPQFSPQQGPQFPPQGPQFPPQQGPQQSQLSPQQRPQRPPRQQPQGQTTTTPPAQVVFVNNRPTIATMAPFVQQPTPSPAFLRCFDSCPTTSEYNPICGSDQQRYFNEQKFNCALRCGANIQIVRRGSCEGLFPMMRG